MGGSRHSAHIRVPLCVWWQRFKNLNKLGPCKKTCKFRQVPKVGFEGQATQEAFLIVPPRGTLAFWFMLINLHIQMMEKSSGFNTKVRPKNELSISKLCPLLKNPPIFLTDLYFRSYSWYSCQSITWLGTHTCFKKRFPRGVPMVDITWKTCKYVWSRQTFGLPFFLLPNTYVHVWFHVSLRLEKISLVKAHCQTWVRKKYFSADFPLSNLLPS